MNQLRRLYPKCHIKCFLVLYHNIFFKKKTLFRQNFRESYLSDTNTNVKALLQIPYHEILPIKVSGEKKVEEKKGCHRRWGMGKS